jgi:hypothetical protein
VFLDGDGESQESGRYGRRLMIGMQSGCRVERRDREADLKEVGKQVSR